MSDEPLEVEELERTAAWRMRLVDQDPADARSLAAARLLEKLANDLRGLRDPGAWAELGAICNWLGESDMISDYAEAAQEYRAGIGVDHFPADGAAYLAALTDIARRFV
jgi:hypothetical protein